MKKGYKKKKVNYRNKKQNVKNAVTPSVKKYVKKSLDNRIENKKTNIDSGEEALYNANNASFYPIVLTPSPSGTLNYNITQGTTQSTRIGNKVNIKKALVKLVIYPTIYDAGTHNLPMPNYVMVYIFGMKPQYDTFAQVTSAINPVNGTFFQDGNASKGFQSLLTDLLSDVNTDVVTPFYKRVVKIGPSSFTGSGNQINEQYYNNNDFKYSSLMKIDITKHFPKVLLWNDSSTTVASRGMYMVLVPCHADGSTSINTQVELTYEAQIDLEYEDA